jgi:hypothetical protein
MSGKRADMRDRIGRFGNASRPSTKRYWGVVNETPHGSAGFQQGRLFFEGFRVGEIAI